MDKQVVSLELKIGLIFIEGDLLAVDADRIESAFAQFFKRGVYNFIVDLSELNLITSRMAGIFIRYRGPILEHNGVIVFTSPIPKVKEIFKLLGLSKVFTITENPKDALAIVYKQAI